MRQSCVLRRGCGACLVLLSVLAGCDKRPAPVEKRAPPPTTAAPVAKKARPAPAAPAPDAKALEKKVVATAWQGVAGGKPLLALFQPYKGKLYAAIILGTQEMTCAVDLGVDGRISITTPGRPTAGGLATHVLGGKLSPDARLMKGTIELIVKQGFVETANGAGDWELKQGDKDLEVEYFKSSCEGGSPRGCFNLASRYRNGTGVAKDEKKGFALVRKACDLGGLPHACAIQGSMLFEGKGAKKNVKRGRAMMKKACDDGTPSGCNSLAWNLAEQSKELDEALALAQRAVKLEPNAAYIDTLAYVHLKRKEYDEAEQEALRAVKLDPGVEEFKKRLADIRAAKGE